MKISTTPNDNDTAIEPVTETTSPDGTPEPWRQALGRMHRDQARCWDKSAAHWRKLAARCLAEGDVSASAKALEIAHLEEGWAQEERVAAEKLMGNPRNN